MKLTAILFFIGCLQVSANGFAQGKITIRKTNASLEDVLVEINKQTGVLYSANQEALSKAKPVSINVKEVGLSEVLAICFSGQPLTYSLKENVIIVKEKVVAPKVTIVDERNPIDVRGKVTDEKGNPIAGVTVTIKGTNKQTLTDEYGEFSLSSIDQEAVLIFTSVNMENFEVRINGQAELAVKLKTKVREMTEVVVSTGYQQIPKERATGSFAVVDNSLINRSVSTNILDRLQGVVSGLLFKSGSENFGDQRSNIQIRSTSTILSDRTPLIVVDNFPYDGNINNINPNDIESITVLKDAAAASIWGVRASNGVIVITTKKGKYNQRVKVSLVSNLTSTDKPDLFYAPTLPSSDFVDLETFLFNNGRYENEITNPQRPGLSPAVEILLKRRNGEISAADSATQLNALKSLDVRNDLLNHFYKRALAQQYALNLTGGSNNQQYMLSVGYDFNQNSNDDYNRFSLNGSNTYALLSKRLEITTGIALSQTWNKNFGSQYSFRQPYGRLVDENGNAAPVWVRRQGYVDTAGAGKLLDWRYYPLNERKFADNKTTGLNYRLYAGIKYKIWKDLDVDIKYQYTNEEINARNHYSLQTYYARDLINQFTNFNQTAAHLRYPVPVGGILDQMNNTLIAHNTRAQLNYSGNLNTIHSINAIAGFEVGSTTIRSNSYRYYGYNDELGTSLPVDNTNNYPDYISGNPMTIPSSQGVNGLNNRYVSAFANAAYSYNSRYTVSFSARRDGANIFGTNTNNKWKPLWSVGAAWDISKEAFYKVGWLNSLKFRTSYGYQGNVGNSVAGVLTILNSGATQNVWKQSFASISNYPNPDLRWEKVATYNAGLDFSVTKGWLSGSIEYYRKKGTDLLGATELAPSSGVAISTANTADMKGEGLDLTLSFQKNIGTVQWSSTLLFSYARDWVTAYKLKPSAIQTYIQNGTVNPVVGKPVTALYSYRWASLDPLTGDPQAYLSGKPGKDYALIVNSPDINDMKYIGPSVPPYFGSLLNNFTWKNFTVSFNIVYKLGYYFRRSSIDYNSLYTGGDQGNTDYNSRWQKPGDEAFTNVPSMVYPIDPNRDEVYGFSDILFERGDHIRLQDIRLSYDFNKQLYKRLPFQNSTLFLYASNLNVLIWKANDLGVDPDYLKQNQYSFGLPGRRITAGLKIDF